MKFEATIVKGKGRGKKLGYPTINCSIPPSFPYDYGIYAGWVYAEEKKYRAAFHFGPIPVFNDPTPSLEAFVIDDLFDFSKPRISFEITSYLREIRNFSSIELLRAQIKKDVAQVKKLLP